MEGSISNLTSQIMKIKKKVSEVLDVLGISN